MKDPQYPKKSKPDDTDHVSGYGYPDTDTDTDTLGDRDPRTLRGIHPKRTGPPSLEMYIPLSDLSMVERFKEAMKRDGSSASSWILDRIREWDKAHAPGNPQTPLERFPLDIVQKGEVIMKEPRDERWERLWNMTTEQLLERQLKLMDRPGTYMERLEMSMILLHRRLNQPT